MYMSVEELLLTVQVLKQKEKYSLVTFKLSLASTEGTQW